jgi:sulfur carrier protein ThiS
MKTATSNTIEVTFIRMGASTQVLTLPANADGEATYASLIEKIGTLGRGEVLSVGSTPVTPDALLENGDVVTVSQNKQGGNA